MSSVTLGKLLIPSSNNIATNNSSFTKYNATIMNYFSSLDYKRTFHRSSLAFYVTTTSSPSSSPSSYLTTDNEFSTDREGAPIIRVSKFFQAILTIIICAVIISTTLCLILRIKFWCRKPPKPKNGSAISLSVVGSCNKNGHCGNHSPPGSIITNYKTIMINGRGSEQSIPPYWDPSMNTFQHQRRLSGPFGDEALEFVHQSYKKKNKLKSTLNQENGLSTCIKSKPNKREVNGTMV